MLQTKLDVRRCNRRDLSSVEAIERACFGIAGALPRVSLTQYFDLCEEAFLVGEIESQVVAFAIGGIATGRHGQIGWILDVAVFPGHQRKGIGLVLCERVCESLRSVGALRVRATVAPDNLASQGMLSRLGFAIVDEMADYFGPGEARLVVERAWRGGGNA